MSTQPQSRVQPGVSEGGQFAATHRDAPAVALTEPERYPAVVDDARYGIGDALGIKVDAVEVTEEMGSHYETWTKLRAAVPDDAQGRTVEVTFERTSGTGGRDVGVRVTWPVEPLEEGSFDESSVASEYNPNQYVDPEHITTLVADTVDQARMQAGAEELVNRPQSLANLADRYGVKRPPHEILAFDVTRGGETPVIRVTDYRKRDYQPLLLNVEPGTGRLLGGRVHTEYGLVDLEGENLDRVAHEVDRAVYLAEGNFEDIGDASREGLEARLAQIVNHGTD